MHLRLCLTRVFHIKSPHDVTLLPVFRFPARVANRSFLGSETVWVTLRERAPPMLSAALSAAKVLKPRKRNFDTVKRTRLFAKALQEGDGAGAAMMLSAMTRLEFGRVIASGATEGVSIGSTPAVDNATQ